MAFTIEAHAIDHGVIFFQAKQAGLWVARLGLGRDGAHLDKAKALGQHGSKNAGVFIKARR